jgi:hypothetical protein
MLKAKTISFRISFGNRINKRSSRLLLAFQLDVSMLLGSQGDPIAYESVFGNL